MDAGILKGAAGHRAGGQCGPPQRDSAGHGGEGQLVEQFLHIRQRAFVAGRGASEGHGAGGTGGCQALNGGQVIYEFFISEGVQTQRFADLARKHHQVSAGVDGEAQLGSGVKRRRHADEERCVDDGFQEQAQETVVAHAALGAELHHRRGNKAVRRCHDVTGIHAAQCVQRLADVVQRHFVILESHLQIPISLCGESQADIQGDAVDIEGDVALVEGIHAQSHLIGGGIGSGGILCTGGQRDLEQERGGKFPVGGRFCLIAGRAAAGHRIPGDGRRHTGIRGACRLVAQAGAVLLCRNSLLCFLLRRIFFTDRTCGEVGQVGATADQSQITGAVCALGKETAGFAGEAEVQITKDGDIQLGQVDTGSILQTRRLRNVIDHRNGGVHIGRGKLVAAVDKTAGDRGRCLGAVSINRLAGIHSHIEQRPAGQIVSGNVADRPHLVISGRGRISGGVRGKARGRACRDLIRGQEIDVHRGDLMVLRRDIDPYRSTQYTAAGQRQHILTGTDTVHGGSDLVRIRCAGGKLGQLKLITVRSIAQISKGGISDGAGIIHSNRIDAACHAGKAGNREPAVFIGGDLIDLVCHNGELRVGHGHIAGIPQPQFCLRLVQDPGQSAVGNGVRRHKVNANGVVIRVAVKLVVKCVPVEVPASGFPACHISVVGRCGQGHIVSHHVFIRGDHLACFIQLAPAGGLVCVVYQELSCIGAVHTLEHIAVIE